MHISEYFATRQCLMHCSIETKTVMHFTSGVLILLSSCGAFITYNNLSNSKIYFWQIFGIFLNRLVKDSID